MNPPKRMSVFTATALGITAVLVTCIISSAVIVVYGMRVIDKKSDAILSTARSVIGELPALKAALPPALADAIRDERRPDYTENLKIAVEVNPTVGRDGQADTSFSVTNAGDAVVSTLALRVVGMDENARPVWATTEYIATPLAIDNEWRGPLMPHATRHASTHQWPSRRVSTVEYEVTELRLWKPATPETSELEATASAALVP
jgi:hypothetical protein